MERRDPPTPSYYGEEDKTEASEATSVAATSDAEEADEQEEILPIITGEQLAQAIAEATAVEERVRMSLKQGLEIIYPELMNKMREHDAEYDVFAAINQASDLRDVVFAGGESEAESVRDPNTEEAYEYKVHKPYLYHRDTDKLGRPYRRKRVMQWRKDTLVIDRGRD